MKAPTRRFLTLSWLGWLNFLLLQWFFVRLYLEVGRKAPTDLYEIRGVGLYIGMVPLTGWWNHYWPLPLKHVCFWGEDKTDGQKPDRIRP